jgi:hypothetical protein
MRNSTPPKISIELHWNIISDIRSHLCSSIDWFWEQAEEWHELYKVMSISNDNDSKTFILSPTACIIYLSTHLMIQHTPSQPRLLWYYDLYKLLSKSNLQLDWETLPSLAKDLGLELALYDALYNLTERFDVFFPENVLNDLVREHLKYKGFIPRIDFSMQSQAVNTWIWNSLTTVPSLTRLKMVFHLLFPNPAYMRMRYNPHYTWLWPLYYFLRILSILKTSLRIN